MLNKFLNSILPRHALRESGTGFSLVELIVAIGLFFILASGVTFVVINSYSNFFGATDQQAVAKFAQEGLEAVNAMAGQSWQVLENVAGISSFGLAYKTQTADSYWHFIEKYNIQGVLTRKIVVTDISRTNGYIVASGGTDDPLTKKVTVTISADGMTDYVLESYLTKWNSRSWTQTDWKEYGPGYAFWRGDGAYEADDGKNIDNKTVEGGITLTLNKDVYLTPGFLYSSKITTQHTSKELHSITIEQDVPPEKVCDNKPLEVTLQVDNDHGFPSAVTQKFSHSRDGFYTATIDANMHGYDWARYKVDMIACDKDKLAPILYSIKLNYN